MVGGIEDILDKNFLHNLFGTADMDFKDIIEQGEKQGKTDAHICAACLRVLSIKIRKDLQRLNK
jgi:hypothetical protein